MLQGIRKVTLIIHFGRRADIQLTSLMKRQLAFLIARAQIPLEWLHPIEDSDTEDMVEEFPEDLIECLSNAHLSMHFRDYGKELGVLEPKSLEDVYKSHLENTSTPCPLHE